MDFKFNLNTDFKFDGKKTSKETSEIYNDKVRIFLKEMRILNLPSFKESSFIKIKNVITDLRLPKKSEQLRIRVQQSINLIAIIVKIIKEKKIIDELNIATYSLNMEAFEIIEDLYLQKKIKKIRLFISSSYDYRNIKYKKYLIDKCLKMNIKLVFLWIHLKITLVKCGTNFYQFEGSMNYSQNNMAEQLLFENNKYIYNDDYLFFEDICNINCNGVEIIN